MTKVVITHRIEEDLPLEVLEALARACGFHLSYDRSPDVDSWTLSHGHGRHRHEPTHVDHVGTRRGVCAFLLGYADMQLQVTQALNEVESANRDLIHDMRDRLCGASKEP